MIIDKIRNYAITARRQSHLKNRSCDKRLVASWMNGLGRARSSLSNDDCDVNENGIKEIRVGLDW